jgi:protein O-mannosyl-transferase
MTKRNALAAPAAHAAVWGRWAPLLVFVATLLAYGPALRAGFIWDDHPGHVTRPELQSLAGLGRIWWDLGATQQYYPVLHSAFWLEHRLWEETAFGYHFLNVLWHATAACLFARLLVRLAVPGAWFAAALFALHPVMVESVAWISEQKNTLSTIFYLCAALAYLRYDDDRRPGRYAAATVWFIAALLTKTVTATLPAALLVVLWWKRGTLDWRRDVRPLAPWLALGISAGALTAWVEHAQIGAQGAPFTLGAAGRVLLAARATWFYFSKLIWPADLIFIYPRWEIEPGRAWPWAWLVLTTAGAVALAQRSRSRGPKAAALLFVGTLFPALGFINVFPFLYSYVADHFQYLAALAPIAALSAAVVGATAAVPAAVRRGAGLALLGILGVLTWRQATTYRDVFTLYATTIAKNPGCWMAHNNLAIALGDAGRPDEALSHYEAAIRLKPDYAEAENNFGYALNQLNRAADALPHLQRALALQPRYAEAQNNLGAAYMQLGRVAEGIAAFTAATELNPSFALAQVNLGRAIASSGRPADGIPHFQRALELDRNNAEAELDWGIALTLLERPTEAFTHFDRAIRLRPDWTQAHHSYGRALAAAGRFDDAVAQFNAALEIEPGFSDAHFQLALALRQMGRLDEAEQHLRASGRR